MSIKYATPLSDIEVSEYLPFSEYILGSFCLSVRTFYSSCNKIACGKRDKCSIFLLFLCVGILAFNGVELSFSVIYFEN